MNFKKLSGGSNSFSSTILNIIGIAFAFATFYVIMVQVNYSLGYNKQIKDKERIFVIANPDWYTPGNWMTQVSRPYYEDAITNISCVEAGGTGNIGNVGKERFSHDETFLSGFDLYLSTFSIGGIKTFGFEAVSGSFDDLATQADIAIRESKAKELGISVGDILYNRFYDQRIQPVRVVAIYKDFQRNSDLHSFDAVRNIGDESIDSFSEWSYNYFVKLYNTEDKELFEQQSHERLLKLLKEAASVAGENISEEDMEYSLERLRVKLFPITEMIWDKTVQSPGLKGNKTTTYTLMTIAILIILIAFINFINFFFALVPIRLKSVNTRKILGATRKQLVLGLVGESVVMIVVAIIIGIGIISLFNGSTLASLLTSTADFGVNIGVLAGTIATTLILGILSSLYPAFYITSFSPAFALKGSLGSVRKGKVFRYGLIGFQFVVSICLIICATFITMQRSYMLNHDMGFDKGGLLQSFTSYKMASMHESITSRLLENPQIKDITWASGPLVSPGRMGWGREIKGENIAFECYPVTWNFLRFMGIDIIEGRDFQKSDEESETGVFIFNRAAKEKFGLSLEDKVNGHNGDTGIAGFCENFNYKALGNGIEPFALYIFGKHSWKTNNTLYIRANENADMTAIRSYAKEILAEADPSVAKDEIEVTFFEENLEKQYIAEQRSSRIILIFTILAILISLMGVFGLSMFEAEYRRREVSMRRVNGASINDILVMFSAKFVRIVTVCFIIAAPVSWFITDYYLKTFAYRTPMYWWVYALAFIVVTAVTIAVVVARSWNAATEDPATTLRKE